MKYILIIMLPGIRCRCSAHTSYYKTTHEFNTTQTYKTTIEPSEMHPIIATEAPKQYNNIYHFGGRDKVFLFIDPTEQDERAVFWEGGRP